MYLRDKTVQSKIKILLPFKTPVTFNQSTHRNIPEDLHFEQYRCENPKPHSS